MRLRRVARRRRQDRAGPLYSASTVTENENRSPR